MRDGEEVIEYRVPDAARHEMTRRRAWTYAVSKLDPGSAAHHFVLRSIRGTPPLPSYTTTLSLFAARVMPV
jgi:hypothetical protein